MNIPVHDAGSVTAENASNCDLLVTTTSPRAPVIMSECVQEGTCINATALMRQVIRNPIPASSNRSSLC